MAAACREQLLYFARLSEQAERYDEMAAHIEQAVRLDDDLSLEERSLLSVSFSNAVGQRRAAWRALKSFEERGEARDSAEEAAWRRSYRGRVEQELRQICGTILGLLGSNLIPNASTTTAKLSYLKMKGDYHRYLAEFEEGDAKAQAGEMARAAYADAWSVADLGLPATDPIRLGTALSHATFRYEVLSDRDGAIRAARAAFEGALAELDNLAEDSYKDTTLIMQLLRDNINLWTGEMASGQEPLGPETSGSKRYDQHGDSKVPHSDPLLDQAAPQ